MKIIGAAGVPAGAVHDTLELWNDEKLRRARHHADDEAPGWRWSCARPGRSASTGLPQLEAGAEAGAADQVMASWLKMGPSDVAKLKSEKIIGNS